jgi:hypothetical protein
MWSVIWQVLRPARRSYFKVSVNIPKKNSNFFTAYHQKQGLSSFIWSSVYFIVSPHITSSMWPVALSQWLRRQHVFGIRNFADLSLFCAIRRKAWYHIFLQPSSVRKSPLLCRLYMSCLLLTDSNVISSSKWCPKNWGVSSPALRVKSIHIPRVWYVVGPKIYAEDAVIRTFGQ